VGGAERIETLPGLPERSRDAHKGRFGRVLVVGCSPGMTGAGCMAALGAQRAGAGLVTLALPQSLHPVAEVKLTSAMSRPLPEPGEAVVGEEAAETVLGWQGEFDVVALGPGMGRAPETERAVRRLVGGLAVPLVVDADGLNALAADPGVLRQARAPRLLTPHPGEMARLLGHGDPARVQEARQDVAVAFAAEHAVLLALKGAGTVVTDGRRLYVNPTGNPGMATGGTGDVLTGLAAGLCCQGLEPFEALQLAVFVHGLAGDLAARERGELSLTAEDVLERTGEAFRRFRALGQGLEAGEAAARIMAEEGR
jgi:NAD(P)H-hydrate epimerase